MAPTTKRRAPATPRTRTTAERGRRRARPAEPPREAAAAAAEPAAPPLSVPEPAFAARVPPPAVQPPRPTARRGIFIDVENTSRPQDLQHVIDHLAIDRRDSTTELVAVANWKVVSHDAARLLARLGAHLVHSAPSTGVRDWSDLRIAVSAGIWLAGARPGDRIDIVSDDRAFDAVGDVAASLGIPFRRLSYRQLIKEAAAEVAPAPRVEPEAGPRGRRRRPRGGRGRAWPAGPPRAVGRERAAELHVPAPRAHVPEPAARPAPLAEGEPHTAPHDEIVAVVRSLLDSSGSRTVSIDAVANALKARGFRRPPGSPRLVTRLRRIRELAVSPSGGISLAEAPAPAWGPERDGGEPPAGDASGEPPAEGEEAPAEPAGPASGGEASRRRRRRRRRRGGGRRGAGHRPAPHAGPPA